MVLIAQEPEDRVAFLNLAFANRPQVDCAVHDACCTPCLEFGLQCQAVEFGNVESLVELLVNAQVAVEVANAGQVQGVAVA